MLKTVEAIIDEHGDVRLLEKIKIKGHHRAVVTILDDIFENKHIPALLSEAALAKDWNRPEEDEAWENFQ